MKVKNVLETIGSTPHLRINRLFGDKVSVWVKLERANPGASIKDRIALAMIEDAESRGVLKSGMTIIEPTSGNTGIGLAMVAAVKGYQLILVMPESMSIERRKIMAAYGAKLALTPKEKGMPGAISRAIEMLAENPNAWMPQQFENEANTEIHIKTTAAEILRDFPDGLDYLITGVGTGGHISGCGEVLKKNFPKMRVFAVEPEASPVLSGGAPGPHPLQGIGAGFVPKILRRQHIDEVIKVANEDAFNYVRRMAKEEGVLVGVSTGASLAAVAQKLKSIPDGSTVLTFCYDTGERYLSVDALWNADS
ncbi:cysteine synthase A [bacterium]|nr:cysteine synthase A [bacterium]MBU1637377.1 cysteine synthase A [bacterium]MBU1921550.1 cysteine synthase A [bacterium]